MVGGPIEGASTGLKVVGLVLVPSAGRHILLHPVPALPLLVSALIPPGHCKHQPSKSCSLSLSLEFGLLSSTHVGLLRAERGFNVDLVFCEISSQPLALAVIRAQLTPAVLRPCLYSSHFGGLGCPVSGLARTDQAWGMVPTPVGSFS